MTLPQRCDADLAELRTYQTRHLSIIFNTHFNCIEEATEAAWDACDRIASSGTPMNNQMVLMRRINDSVERVAELNERLLQMRVKPYYMLQCDLAEGVSHFRTSIATGLRILRGLRGHMSGMASPRYISRARRRREDTALAELRHRPRGGRLIFELSSDIFRYPESELALDR